MEVQLLAVSVQQENTKTQSEVLHAVIAIPATCPMLHPLPALSVKLENTNKMMRV